MFKVGMNAKTGMTNGVGKIQPYSRTRLSKHFSAASSSKPKSEAKLSSRAFSISRSSAIPLPLFPANAMARLVDRGRRKEERAGKMGKGSFFTRSTSKLSNFSGLIDWNPPVDPQIIQKAFVFAFMFYL